MKTSQASRFLFLKKWYFREPEYFLFDTPVWTDQGDRAFDEISSPPEKRSHVAEEKKRALEKELREVSIRVNLFEKILIPRASGKYQKDPDFSRRSAARRRRAGQSRQAKNRNEKAEA